MKKILLKEAEKHRDTVPAKLCNCLYDVCNNVLFKATTPVMFCVHMNMLFEDSFFIPRRNKGVHICFMVFMVEQQIPDEDHAIEWSTLFIERCDIKDKYYKSHRSDDLRSDSSRSVEFREDIENAIKTWKAMGLAPR